MAEPVTHFEDDVVVSPTLQQVSVTPNEGEPAPAEHFPAPAVEPVAVEPPGEPAVSGGTGGTGAFRADTVAEEMPPAESETSRLEVPTFEPSPVPTPAATGAATAAATPEPLVVSAFERRHNDTAADEDPGAADSARPRRGRPESRTSTPMIDADARQAVRRTSAKSVTPGSEETGR